MDRTGRDDTPRSDRADRTDGRTLRSRRTRKAIVDANLNLMMEGTLRPTAAQIAQRAGVSTRALYSHFPDLESLFASTGERTMAVQYEGYEHVPSSLPPEERVRAFCQQRARMLESIGGASRAAQARLPFSAQLRRNRARHNDRLRVDLGVTFAPEIAAAGESASALVSALLVATTWPAWMGARDDLDLSIEEATGVMERTVLALINQFLTHPWPSERAASPPSVTG